MALLDFIRAGWIKSAHDCSDGGLMCALAECCFSQDIALNTPKLKGAEIDLTSCEYDRVDALLFGETQGRIILTANKTDIQKLINKAAELSIPLNIIGKVSSSDLYSPTLSVKTKNASFSWNVSELYSIWWNTVENIMEQK